MPGYNKKTVIKKARKKLKNLLIIPIVLSFAQQNIPHLTGKIGLIYQSYFRNLINYPSPITPPKIISYLSPKKFLFSIFPDKLTE
ncbi:hypothetical protein GCWU000342_00603 [Shuttleworthella satelles DSM 14600]|uniref:Uncharacterized protein n=1 Tax=Shuttleworthella satelles DSM 14600 TaxID=626523 RepID=C4G9F1_9FIRM|nr:hypothetical protein GCWU000342_00603 [Shuttleworthia satelles DSM 14600]